MKKENNLSRTIGANIKRLRLRYGETQKELGDELGYGGNTIANYEKGYRLPDLETFFKIALRYQASLEDFLMEDFI